MSSLIGSIPQLVTEFTHVALSDPLSAISMAFGTIFIAFAVLVFAYLTLGAVVDFVTPDISSRGPPRQAQ